MFRSNFCQVNHTFFLTDKRVCGGGSFWRHFFSLFWPLARALLGLCIGKTLGPGNQLLVVPSVLRIVYEYWPTLTLRILWALGISWAPETPPMWNAPQIARTLFTKFTKERAYPSAIDPLGPWQIFLNSMCFQKKTPDRET